MKPSSESSNQSTGTLDGGLFEPGERLGDNYEVLEFISAGADAEVYRVLNRTDNHEYAAKVPLDGNASHQFQHENEIYRVVREKTNSDHLVKVHPAIEHEGCPIIIMEFLKGRSLQNVIDAEKPKSEARIHRIVTNILEGLNELHRAGIIHCDIKPSNVILTKRGAVLFDFSASLIEKEVDQNSPRRGSKNYMPPDVLPSFAWDVYSVGVIYYQLFLGAPPNWTRNTTDKTSTEPALILPERFGKYLSARPVIMRALSLDSNQRYQHAGEMLEDMIKPLRSGRFLEGIRIFDRRYPALLKIAGVLLVIVLLAVQIRSCQSDREEASHAPTISEFYSLNPTFLLEELDQLPNTGLVRGHKREAEYILDKLDTYEGIDLGISGIKLLAHDHGKADSYNIRITFSRLTAGRRDRVKKTLEWSVGENAFVWSGGSHDRVGGVTKATMVKVELEAKQPWINPHYYSPALGFTRLQSDNYGHFHFQDEKKEFVLRFEGGFYVPEDLN